MTYTDVSTGTTITTWSPGRWRARRRGIGGFVWVEAHRDASEAVLFRLADQAFVALGHAEALWHTLWFHAISLSSHPTDVEQLVAACYGDADFDDEDDRQQYIAHLRSRDLAAELHRHTSVVEAICAAYRSWRIEPPAVEDIPNWPTWSAWRATLES